MDAYLLKPAAEEKILSTIDKCLSMREVRGAYVAAKELRGESDEITTVVEYIDKNYRHALNLQELADLVHFSPSYLSRLFHRSKGVTLKTYINSI